MFNLDGKTIVNVLAISGAVIVGGIAMYLSPQTADATAGQIITGLFGVIGVAGAVGTVIGSNTKGDE